MFNKHPTQVDTRLNVYKAARSINECHVDVVWGFTNKYQIQCNSAFCTVLLGAYRGQHWVDKQNKITKENVMKTAIVSNLLCL